MQELQRNDKLTKLTSLIDSLSSNGNCIVLTATLVQTLSVKKLQSNVVVLYVTAEAQMHPASRFIPYLQVQEHLYEISEELFCFI